MKPNPDSPRIEPATVEFPKPTPPEALAEITVSGVKPRRFATFTGDSGIGASIRRAGKSRESYIQVVCRFMRERGVEVKGTFLDIGANIGTHAIYAVTHGFDRAYCFEPDPDNFMLLRVNQILNDVDQKCINFNCALSDSDGSAQFELSPHNHGDHRVVNPDARMKAAKGEDKRRRIEVSLVKFDTLAADGRMDPASVGLTWIDTQGHEGQVLAGAQALIDRASPVVIEFWPYGLARSGGYPALRERMLCYEHIFDLQKQIVPIAMSELDNLFTTMTTEDRVNASWHTDLLLSN